MSETSVITELTRKHRALIADLISADEHVKTVHEQIRAIETVLRLIGFEGEMPVYPVRRATFPIFAHGEISREVAALHRESPQLRKPREIAKEIMLRKDWDCENLPLWGRVTAAVKDCNKRRKVRRPAAKCVTSGKAIGW